MTPASDETEAGALFTAYHDRICRYIAGMVRDPAEAEDLTQETFLRAHCRQEALRDPKAARGWLYRIATNVCLDRCGNAHGRSRSTARKSRCTSAQPF
jgi:RNA polymerase sigma-70 factor, ECF subfamily